MLEALQRLVGKENAFADEPMKNHTTFRVGGNARFFVEPETTEDLKAVLAWAKQEEVPYYIVGNGSNLLVSDEGYDGLIIHLFKNMSKIVVEGNTITAQAGALLVKTASMAYRAGLTGLEFASGIPGTIGGAMVMNAGAYGGEMKDVTKSVTVLTNDGDVVTYSGEEMEFGYRRSRITKMGGIVLEAVLELKAGDPEAIRARMDELKIQRQSKQPLEFASAGSTFKRPEGYFAGKLIQDAGLRGYAVGDAQVSEKHCGFVINRGEATASDVMELIRHVQKKVYDTYGVNLETEVKMLGRF